MDVVQIEELDRIVLEWLAEETYPAQQYYKQFAGELLDLFEHLRDPQVVAGCIMNEIDEFVEVAEQDGFEN